MRRHADDAAADRAAAARVSRSRVAGEGRARDAAGPRRRSRWGVTVVELGQERSGMTAQPRLIADVVAVADEDEAAVRAEYMARLAEYLKDPEFRSQPGFPIGSDEAILAMSAPPYYTACPNPFI